MRPTCWLVVIAAAATLGGCNRQQPAGDPAAVDSASVKGVDRSHKGSLAPATSFRNPDGGEITLASFRGVPVLVNLWATWCAPCVKELPTLERLAQSHAANGQLGVVTISQDTAPQGSVKAFMAKLGLSSLGAYHDPNMALAGALSAQVLPTSILYDRQGREVWRYVGDLDWTGEEARKLISEVR